MLRFGSQGQTAFDVADEDVLGYLEELQKKQNLVISHFWHQIFNCKCNSEPCLDAVCVCFSF